MKVFFKGREGWVSNERERESERERGGGRAERKIEKGVGGKRRR